MFQLEKLDREQHETRKLLQSLELGLAPTRPADDSPEYVDDTGEQVAEIETGDMYVFYCNYTTILSYITYPRPADTAYEMMGLLRPTVHQEASATQLAEDRHGARDHAPTDNASSHTNTSETAVRP